MGQTISYPFFRMDMANTMGGSFESAYETAANLPERYEPLVTLSGEGEPLERAQRYNFPTDILYFTARVSTKVQGFPGPLRRALYAIDLLPYWRRAYRYIRQKGVSLIHTNDPISGLLWGTCANIAGIPFVAHLRGDYISPTKVRWISRLADHIIFVADSGQTHQGPNLAQNTPSSVIYNGVDVDRFRPDGGEAIRDELGINDDAPLIGFIGNLVPRKRPMLFVEAALEYLEENEGHFVVVGGDSNDYHTKIRSRVSETGHRNEFHLLGFRDDVAAITGALDLLVLTSTREGEGFPRTPLEAMAAGTPVVTTDTGGVREAVIDGESGRVLGTDPTPEQIAEAIKSLISNRDTWAKFSESARENVVRNFSSASAAERTAAIYDDLL